MDVISHFSLCTSKKKGKGANEIEVLTSYIFFIASVEYKGKATSYTYAKETFLKPKIENL